MNERMSCICKNWTLARSIEIECAYAHLTLVDCIFAEDKDWLKH